jgi:hypothetical protein
MPKARRTFEEVLLTRFPAAEELALSRIFTDHKKTFFESHTRRPLYPVPLILAGLLLAQRYAHKAGFKLDLSADEKRALAKGLKIKG